MSATNTEIFSIRPLEQGDRDQWAVLFEEFRSFHGFEPDNAVVFRVWSWLVDEEHPEQGITAVTPAGMLLGIAHYRVFPRTIDGGTGVYLDDLVTHPEARNGGVGKALIRELDNVRKGHNSSVVRWISASGNLPARRLYDKLADGAKSVS